MKRTTLLGAALALLLAWAAGGCAEARYSNLTDADSRLAVASAWEAHGLKGAPVEKVLSWVEAYNAAAKGMAAEAGFAPLPEAGADYGAVVLNDTAEDYLSWLNCRLTAFSLLGDWVETAGTEADTDAWLMFDVEAIDTLDELRMSEESRADFVTLFHPVSIAGAATLEAHEAQIVEAWTARDIRLTADGVSLICIYLHMPEDEVRFVGHTGVLTETEDGLLFFEKYSSLAPFQATLFSDRAALKRYLLDRADLYGDETELAPIVTENGCVL